MFDLVNNPGYDWYQRYAVDLNAQCQNFKKTRIFIWSLNVLGFRHPPALFFAEFIHRKFANAQISFYTGYIFKKGTRDHSYIYSVRTLDTKSTEGFPSYQVFIRTKEMVEETEGDIDIHMLLCFKDITNVFDVSLFAFNDNTLKIVLDNNIPEPPTVNKNGHFVIWEEGIMNPLFVDIFIERINLILCGKTNG